MIHHAFHYGDEEHAFFTKEGYFVFDHFLTEEAVCGGRDHADRMFAQLADGIRGTEIMAPHQLGEKWIWDIATDPKVLDHAERQLGPNLVL